MAGAPEREELRVAGIVGLAGIVVFAGKMEIVVNESGGNLAVGRI